MSIAAVSPLLLKRYELKYLIPLHMVDAISRDLEVHCAMDYYSQISPDKFYTINSLYFDTHNFQFLQRKISGIDRTWSMRVRSYGDQPKPPFFTEIKLKVNDFSNKMRAKIFADDWAHVLQSGEIPPETEGSARAYLNQFIYLLGTHGAEPKILTQYRRKAYLSQIDDYARVTFDRDLRYQLVDGDYTAVPDERKMCNYDHEEIFHHPEENVIMELKCEKRIPLWMIQLIKKYEVTRVGFSKYGNSVYNSVLEELPVASDFRPANI